MLTARAYAAFWIGWHLIWGHPPVVLVASTAIVVLVGGFVYDLVGAAVYDLHEDAAAAYREAWADAEQKDYRRLIMTLEARSVSGMRRTVALGGPGYSLQLVVCSTIVFVLCAGLVHAQDDQVAQLRLSATRGDAQAQAKLGSRYLIGDEVPLDHAEAARWFESAAVQGLDSAQAMLGIMYDNGWGVDQDHAQAARWFRLAAEQGLDTAQSELGRKYFVGQGVVQDWTEAIKWLRPAAENGIAKAQYFLGTLYALGGGGLRRDLVESHKWTNLAASHAEGEAQKRYATARLEITKELTRAQLVEAQKRAREWQDAFDRRPQ